MRLDGEESIEELTEQNLRARILKESEKYLNTPVSSWPKIIFNWDLSRSSQRFALDGVGENDFQKYYPDGFILGYVSLTEFDKILCHFSRRDEGELWELGYPDNLAKLIVYLSENRPISPPLVKPVDNGEVIFQGGHHRYVIAKVTDVDVFPIYIEKHNKIEIDKRLFVNWKNA